MTASQAAVLRILKDRGPMPDHVLVPIVQHLSGDHFSSSRIRTARNELCRQKLVKEKSQIKMPSGRMASVWTAK